VYVTNDDTAAPIGLSPRALENLEEARLRRIVEYGGARSAQTRAVPGRLEAEREIWQQSRLTRRRSGAGSSCTRVTSNIAWRGVPRLEEGMRKAAPEYWPDRRYGVRARDGGDRRTGRRRPHAGAGGGTRRVTGC
jgi:hypothetical protein